MTKPHSDKSNRAKRRRQEKEIERAQRAGARPPAVAPPSRGAQQGVPIDISALYQRIGVLTVERDYWAARATEASVAAIVDPAGEEMRRSALRAMQPYQEGAVDQAREAAEDAVDAEAQAVLDKALFPELQNTDGDVLAEEGEDPDLQVTAAVEADDPFGARIDLSEQTEEPEVLPECPFCSVTLAAGAAHADGCEYEN